MRMELSEWVRDGSLPILTRIPDLGLDLAAGQDCWAVQHLPSSPNAVPGLVGQDIRHRYPDGAAVDEEARKLPLPEFPPDALVVHPPPFGELLCGEEGRIAGLGLGRGFSLHSLLAEFFVLVGQLLVFVSPFLKDLLYRLEVRGECPRSCVIVCVHCLDAKSEGHSMGGITSALHSIAGDIQD